MGENVVIVGMFGEGDKGLSHNSISQLICFFL